MASFVKNCSLSQFQNLIQEIYGLPDDRLFSLHDLLSNQERFTMRAIKGVRKKDRRKIIKNLLIAFSWCMAVANRLHIDIEKEVWRRFPLVCSYCGNGPCICLKEKIVKRVKITRRSTMKPPTLAAFQAMFAQIYPPNARTVADAGVHLAEETGEVSEAAHVFVGEHKNNQFNDLKDEIADWVSCMFGLANSAKIDVAEELSKMYEHNCHVCHSAPCTCSFSSVAKYK